MKIVNPYAVPGLPYFSNLTAEIILKKVTLFYNLKHDIKIKPNSRERSIVFPRQVASYLLKNEAKLSQSEIARILNQSHATVINSLKIIDNYLQTNKKFKEEYNNLIIKLK